MGIIVEDPLGSPGVGVDLRAIWFNVAANPADLCKFEYAGPALSLSTGLRGEFRQNATTRRLVITDTRSYESFNLTLERCDREQVEWLVAHVSQTLCVRDYYGSKGFVAYLEAPREISTLPTDEFGHANADGDYFADVKLSLTEIDFTEAV